MKKKKSGIFHTTLNGKRISIPWSQVKLSDYFPHMHGQKGGSSFVYVINEGGDEDEGAIGEGSYFHTMAEMFQRIQEEGSNL
jgi:type V secretory pathway adhesin AidA